MTSLKQFLWAVRYKRAVREARKMRTLFGMTYYVILLENKLKVVPKQRMKQLISQRRFKPGTTIRDIEKKALFIAK